jgi:para-aminobenzoate synthetase component I
MTPRVMSPVRALKAAAREVPWPEAVESVFLRLSRRRGCLWLDSAGGPEGLARWSVLAAEPAAVLSHEGDATCLRASAGKLLVEAVGSPLAALRSVLASVAIEGDAAVAALPFGPGLYGYMAYDLAPYVEPTAALSPTRDVTLPDMWFGLYEAVLVLDHPARRAWMVGAPGPSWDALAQALQSAAADRPESPDPRPAVASVVQRAVTVNMTDDQYLRAVERALEYIAAGDIFQVNLSRRLTVPLPGLVGRARAGLGGSPQASDRPDDAAELYLRLRRANPAPFGAYVGLGSGQAVLSSSPELFLDCRRRRVVTRPIKGTRPRRPGDEVYNAAQRAALVASEKDRAELVMIVDLERNDLGRVASYWSVRVTEPRAVEAYASVFHTVATVEGRLHEGRDMVDLLRATFPGGSVTGAPKVRAMQIIAELEPTRRSVYTGSVGYLGFAADDPGAAERCALNIAIRTLLVSGPDVFLQVGGGIVADSDPHAELDETAAKAGAMLIALGIGGDG